MGALSLGVAEAVARKLSGSIRPPHLVAVQDWRDSDCSDPSRAPSEAIAPAWYERGAPPGECNACSVCRPEQRTPGNDDAWDTWLYLAGRGAGKTRSAAEDMTRHAALNMRWRMAILAPTYADARDTCVEGESGIQAVLTRWGWEDGREYLWNRSLGELKFRDTRSQFKLFSGEKPARLRGPQHHRAWVEELAQVVRVAPDAWDMLQFGLRLGKHPKAIATTTPLPLKLIKNMVSDPRAAVTRGATDDNAANLPAVTLRKLHMTYDNTRLGRQELGGEILDDIPGALWQHAWFDAERVPVDLSVLADIAPDEQQAPTRTYRDARALLIQAALRAMGIVLIKVVVGVDPAVTSGEDADESGLVVVGLASDGYLYVLEDASLRDTPDAVMTALIEAHDRWQANTVVVEINNGGEWIPDNLTKTLKLLGREAGSIACEPIHAKKGKRVRAEPVSARYEQRRVRHVADLDKLEDQLATWESSSVASPDRMDGLVYAVLWLDDQGQGSHLYSTRAQIQRHVGRTSRPQMPTTSVRR